MMVRKCCFIMTVFNVSALTLMFLSYSNIVKICIVKPTLRTQPDTELIRDVRHSVITSKTPTIMKRQVAELTHDVQNILATKKLTIKMQQPSKKSINTIHHPAVTIKTQKKRRTHPPKIIFDSKSVVNNLCDGSLTFKPHSKVLSYCVFGHNTREYAKDIPKVLNNKRNSTFYKNWIMRIYHDGSIPEDIMQVIANQRDVQICDGRRLPRYGDLSYIFPMYWRFVTMADPSVDVFCSRDLDSAIMQREENAVEEFMSSKAILHTMRDHPYHFIPMLGGMWCFRNEFDRKLGQQYLEGVIQRASYSKSREDQGVLNAEIWFHARKNLSMVMQHDSYTCKKFKGSRPFPTRRRKDDYFVGRPGHWRTTERMDIKKYSVCPVQCRPVYGKDWEHC